LPLFVGVTSRYFYAYVLNKGLDNTESTYEIAFPTLPETVLELRLVRFWLHQLTRIHFEQGANDFLVMMKRNGLFNSAMIEALFPGQRRHFSFTNFSLKLTDGMSLANLASSLKIAGVVLIDTSNYDYHMESLINFLGECKHDGLPVGPCHLASIEGVRDIQFVQVFDLFFKQLNFL
jgi:hypothetical protein